MNVQLVKLNSNLKAVFLQYLIQHMDELIRIFFRKYDGRLNFEDVIQRAVGADQYAVVAHPVDNIIRVLGGRLQGAAVHNQLDADIKAQATDVD